MPEAVRVDPSPLDSKTADMLRARILSGDFPPGDRLVEVALARRLTVSRGTLRAALKTLVHEGLVEQVAYSKWCVAGLQDDDLAELCSLMGVLEGLAARLAAAAPGRTHALDAPLTTLAQAAELATADADLRTAVAVLSGHCRLQQQYRLVAQLIARYVRAWPAARPDAGRLRDHAARLVAAIGAGDADRAEALGRAHMDVAVVALLDGPPRPMVPISDPNALRGHPCPP